MTPRFSRGRSLVIALVVGLVVVVGATIRLESTVRSASAATAPPRCTDANVRASLLSEGDATQNFVYGVALINVADTSCRLAGYPRLWGVSHGQRRRLAITRHGTFAGNLAPTVLAPREVGELVLSVTDSCNAANTGGQVTIRRLAKAHTYPTLAVVLPGSAVDTALDVNGMDIDVVCGLDVSQLGWSRALSP